MTSHPDYRHRVTVPIRFSDLDAMGHVNNATYMTFLEVGRIGYFRDLGLWNGLPRLIGPIMAKATLDYHLPLSLDDVQVGVLTRCSHLGNKSYHMQHLIVRDHAGQAEIAAHALIVLVAYDYTAGHSIPLPDSWRAAITAYEPGLNQS